MGGEGHMLDLIRRLKDGKEASRLRRERRNDKLVRLRRNNDPYLLPDKIPEEMERIIKDSETKNGWTILDSPEFRIVPSVCVCVSEPASVEQRSVSIEITGDITFGSAVLNVYGQYPDRKSVV